MEERSHTMDLSTKTYLGLAVLALLVICNAGTAYGHGVGSETFPPVDLGGKQVTLEASSLKREAGEAQTISISLLDFDSKRTLQDVTFHIRAERGSQFLFEREFAADSGFLVFQFVSGGQEGIVIQEEEPDAFGSLLGLATQKINVTGPKLAEGGLYTFDVSILTAGQYSKRLAEPLVYDVGVSIPQDVSHIIDHPDYGMQTIRTITYYDEISGFTYDASSKEIKFDMPFEWTQENIDQTSVVHEELVIPKTFGDLMASGFVAYVNDFALPDATITIDDFSDERTVHIVMNRNDLQSISQDNDKTGMGFTLKPDPKGERISAVTENSQFRVLASWEPDAPESGSDVTILFNITDIFLKNMPVSVDYDLIVADSTREIFEHSGTSTDSRDSYNMVRFDIPEDAGRILDVTFGNIAGNPLATVTVPMVVDSAVQASPEPAPAIPGWVRSNAGWWADGQIDDQTFLNGVGHLIATGVIVVPATPEGSESGGHVPGWVRSNAGWWADGQIDDQTFLRALQFLVENGILSV